VESSILVLNAGILFGASVNNVLSMSQGSKEEVSKSIEAGKWHVLLLRFYSLVEYIFLVCL
jgi:hypothetical protein